MNKKGFTLVELIVSFTLAIIIFALLFQIVLSLKDLYSNSILKTDLLTKVSNVSKQINEKIISNVLVSSQDCGSNCLILNYTNGTNSRLIVNPSEKTIEFDNIKTVFPKDVVIDNLSYNYINTTDVSGKTRKIFDVEIPIKIKNENQGIKIIYPIE